MFKGWAKYHGDVLETAYSESNFFLKNGPFPASFSLFSSFQYTVDRKQMFNIKINFCR